MNVWELSRLVRRSWGVLLVGLILGGATGAAISAVTTPLFQAKTRLFVSAQSAQTNADLMQGGNFTQQRMQSYADVATSPRVLGRVVTQLGLREDAQTLAESVSAQAPPDTVMLVITVTDTRASRAAQIADATATSLSEVIAELEKPADGPSPVRATIIEEAEEQAHPVAPRTTRNVAGGVVFGLLLSLGFAILRQTLDTRVRTAEDLKSVTTATVLGAVPFDKAATEHVLLSAEDPHTLRAESLRKVRTNLQFVDVAQHPTSIVVTSCLPGEGKSSTVANLTITLAETGLRLCVIEADLRRPKVVEYMGLEGGAGLTTVLIGEAELDDVLQPWGAVGSGEVDVLATGPLPPNPSELLGSEGMRRVLSVLEERYDMVLIDAPPLLPVTDAAVLATITDGVMLIVGSGKVDTKGLARGLENLETVGARLLGVVMNRVPVSKHSSYYGYGYSYEGYGADPAVESAFSQGRIGQFQASQQAYEDEVEDEWPLSSMSSIHGETDGTTSHSTRL